jgi:hypothetical protein
MYRVIPLLFRHANRVFIAGAVLYVVNVVLFSLAGPSDISRHSFFTALRISTAYTMGRESPRLLTATGSLPVYTELMGWLLCIFGWLLVPLFIGKLVYHANKAREHESDFKRCALNLATEAGLDREKAVKFADAVVQETNEKLIA